MYLTWFSQNTVFSFLLQVYHDMHVTTINSIAKKYFCHYTYMYSYVAIFFAFKFTTLAIEFEEKFPHFQTNDTTNSLLFRYSSKFM